MRTKAVHQAVLRTIHGHVSSKQRSAVEVTTQYLEQLKSVEGNVKSFLTVDEQGALKQVRPGIH
jgi:aspartyl-tRNA(Asn)/glutamyl-tRNA(Gln) amidotransferase subunit A